MVGGRGSQISARHALGKREDGYYHKKGDS